MHLPEVSPGISADISNIHMPGTCALDSSGNGGAVGLVMVGSAELIYRVSLSIKIASSDIRYLSVVLRPGETGEETKDSARAERACFRYRCRCSAKY